MMSSRPIRVFTAVVDWLKTTRQKYRRTLEPVLGAIIIGASFIFLAGILARSWPEVKQQLVDADSVMLLAAQISLLVALGLGGVVWHYVQASAGLQQNIQASVSVHFLSNITKYVPGYGWHYLSKAYFSRRHAPSGKQITLALGTEFLVLISSGLVLAGLWAWMGGAEGSRISVWPRLIWPLLSVVSGAGMAGWSWLLASTPRLTNTPFEWTGLWKAWVAGAIGWIVFAVSAWCTSKALYPVLYADLSQHGFALVMAGILSFLIIVVPGGLGIREAALAYLLAGVMPFTVAVAVSIIIRLMTVIGELLAAAAALPFLHELRSRGSDIELDPVDTIPTVSGTKR